MDTFLANHLLPSHSAAADPSLVPGGRGVYGIAFAGEQQFLEQSGYYDFDRRQPISFEGYELLYVGATGGSLRERLRCHLVGNTRGSSFRQTTGALLAERLNLDPENSGHGPNFGFGESEGRLTEWLLNHTAVTYIEDAQPFALEAELLSCIALPLNLTGRRRHKFSRYVGALKQVYACKPPRQQRSLSKSRIAISVADV